MSTRAPCGCHQVNIYGDVKVLHTFECLDAATTATMLSIPRSLEKLTKNIEVALKQVHDEINKAIK